MSGATSIVMAAAAVAGVVMQQQQASKANKMQKEAMNQAQTNADKQAKAAEEANNKASAKRPDTNAILDAASQSGKAGASGTMLTGPQGVDPNALSLGKNTLLGG